ncbi:MAG: alpha-2-macroglobulin family protein, partial [Lysobacter sp.]
YSLVAHVRDAAPSKIDARGLRTPAHRGSADLALVAATVSAAPPLSLSFSGASAQPGERVRLRLRNDSAQPREIALSVLDDALIGLAGSYWPQFDPNNDEWLGGLNKRRSWLVSASFESFKGGSWRLGLPYQGKRMVPAKWPAVNFELNMAMPSGAPYSYRPDDDAYAVPAYVIDADDGSADAAGVSANESDRFGCETCSVTAIGGYHGRVRMTLQRNRLGEVAPAPPPAESPVGAMSQDEPSGDSTTLDRIQVTGSRISATDLAGPGKVEGVRAPGLQAPTSLPMAMLARVRSRFVDTVHWSPQLRLAPGESREIELTLPDNLTRWRAVAWSTGSDDDFVMTQATLEVGLPLEARLQTPVRLYPGDRARLAANARQTGEGAVQVATELRVDQAGAGVLAQAQSPLALASRGQASFAVEIAPQQVGSLLATASVQAGANRDAVAAPIEVATPLIAGRRTLAGWLDAQPLSLPLPELPAGASQAQVQLSLLRGSAALVDRWTADLHDYPHRCWEQILSRGVAAALSLQRGGSTPWPSEEARAAVREAVENAAVFQNEGGDFRYFNRSNEQLRFDRDYDREPTPEVALTAYSVRALKLLNELGYRVEPRVLEAADDFIGDVDLPAAPAADTAGDSRGFNRAAIAVGAETEPPQVRLDRLWGQWSYLVLPAQVELTRALARAQHASARTAMERLIAQAKRKGLARLFGSKERLDLWMSSDLREQCAVIGLLREYPALGDPDLRRSLIAGLSDLYAGGSGAVDTQTGAYCLWALNQDVREDARTSASASVGLGERNDRLELAPGEQRSDWQAPFAAGGTLQLAATARGNTPLSYVATLDYIEDGRLAVANAIGLAVARRFEVLRDGAWTPLAGANLRENDWVRITLTVTNGATRHFVAITDNAPGGLVPTDLSLSGVGGLDVQKVSDLGSYSFDTRRLDPRKPRFYAEELPPGSHEVHYFARAANAGDYLAAPAQVELMYGSATQARTAAERVTILPPL